MPSILFINRVYPPAEGATGLVLEYVARGFVREGWEVTVLTTTCAGEPVGTKFHGGVRIVRCGVFFSKKTHLARALGYLLMIPSLGIRALLLPRSDVVVTKTDPPMLLVLGGVIKALKGSRLIHWAQDLYPEVAEKAGLFPSQGLVARFLRTISTASMRRHDLTVVVGRCMAERIAERGIAPGRIRVIPNIGIDRKIAPLSHGKNGFRRSHGLENSFVVEYSGNMGQAHEFSTVLAVAKKMQESIEGRAIVFLLIGKGAAVSMLQKEAAEMGLHNVRFLPPLPPGELSESLGAGDLHLVTMKQGMSGLVVPSKFYGVMAAERPCVFIGPENSEIARFLRDYGLGEVIRPGNAGELYSTVLAYRNSPERGVAEGKKGRLIVLKEDSLPMFISAALEVLNT